MFDFLTEEDFEKLIELRNHNDKKSEKFKVLKKEKYSRKEILESIKGFNIFNIGDYTDFDRLKIIYNKYTDACIVCQIEKMEKQRRGIIGNF